MMMVMVMVMMMMVKKLNLCSNRIEALIERMVSKI
jgi:hypothetical protein